MAAHRAWLIAGAFRKLTAVLQRLSGRGFAFGKPPVSAHAGENRESNEVTILSWATQHPMPSLQPEATPQMHCADSLCA